MIGRSRRWSAAVAVLALVPAVAGCSEDDQAAAEATEQVDAAMAAVLPDLLAELDLRSTTGRRSYVDCEVRTRYVSEVQLAGTAYAGGAALARQDEVIAMLAEEAGFTVAEPPTGEGLSGTTAAGVELFVSDPPARDATVGDAGGIRSLTVRGPCLDVSDELEGSLPGAADNADLVPPERRYDPPG